LEGFLTSLNTSDGVLKSKNSSFRSAKIPQPTDHISRQQTDDQQNLLSRAATIYKQATDTEQWETKNGEIWLSFPID